MLFIKNYATTNDSDKKVEVQLGHYADGRDLVSVILPDGDVVPVMVSAIEGLDISIKKSIENIGKKTNSLRNAEGCVSVCLLDDKPTEIAFYVKNQKIALVEGTGDELLPININLVEADKSDTTKRFPRDMVMMICPKKEETVRLEVDPRNIVGVPIIATTTNYQIILAMIKWPTWSSLKFPVYMYATYGEDILGAIQLGSRVENKVNKNQIVDVDAADAKKYLDESARIMKERMEQKASQVKGADNKDNNSKAEVQRNQSNQRPVPKENKDNAGKKKGSAAPNNGGYKGNASVKFPVGKVPQNVGKGGKKKNHRKSGNR